MSAEPMPTLAYRYELLRGDELVATGHLTREEPLGVGERIVLGGRPGIVRTVQPLSANMNCTWSCSSCAKTSTSSPARAATGGGVPGAQDRRTVAAWTGALGSQRKRQLRPNPRAG
jgi:hypothetical protein